MIVHLSVFLAVAGCRGGGQVRAQMTEDMVNIKMLGISVPGVPGEDFPILATVPDTSFSCADKLRDRNYADVAAFCQVYHTCTVGPGINSLKFSRLCPNGTIYDQRGQTCRWWYLVNCQDAELLYTVPQDNTVGLLFPGDYSDTYDYDSEADYNYEYSDTDTADDAEAVDSADASPFDAADPSLGSGNTFLLSVPEELLDDIFNSVNSVKNVTNVGVVPPSVVLPTLPPPTFSSQEGGPRPRPRPQTQRRSQASSRTTSRTRTQTSRRRTQNTSQQRNQNTSQQRGNQNISQQRRNQNTAQQRTPNVSQQRRTQNASPQRRGQDSRSQSNPDTTRTGLRGQGQVSDDRGSRLSQQSQALVIPVPRHTAGVRKQTEVRNGQFLVNFRHPN